MIEFKIWYINAKLNKLNQLQNIFHSCNWSHFVASLLNCWCPSTMMRCTTRCVLCFKEQYSIIFQLTVTLVVYCAHSNMFDLLVEKDALCAMFSVVPAKPKSILKTDPNELQRPKISPKTTLKQWKQHRGRKLLLLSATPPFAYLLKSIDSGRQSALRYQQKAARSVTNLQGRKSDFLSLLTDDSLHRTACVNLPTDG